MGNFLYKRTVQGKAGGALNVQNTHTVLCFIFPPLPEDGQEIHMCEGLGLYCTSFQNRFLHSGHVELLLVLNHCKEKATSA